MTDLVPGAVIAGKYRLDREIGRGGMGSVWAAKHLQLDTLVALKFVDPGTAGPDAHVRFEREAKAAAQLRSPHVVQILDHGVDGQQPYIAMELLEGEDLGERLRRVGRLSLHEASTIFSQAAKALRRAHDAGVIHRDLKPSNIFLARFDEDEVVKLLDFGVAKLRYKEMDPLNPSTQTGVIFGSPTYMSPEQARGNKPIDHRSDLWSLAVILFRALTGSKPFEASSIGDLVIKLCIEPPPIPSKVAPDLPPEVDRFFERAFARDLEQRYSSAMAMAADLEAIARQHSVRRSAEPAPAQAPRPSATPPSGFSAGFPRPVPTPQIIEPPIVASPAPAPPVLPPPSQPTPAPFSPPVIRTAPIPAAPVFAPAPIMNAGAPPSMTPSPTLLTPRAVLASSPGRTPLIAAVALGAGAFVLLLVVIGVLRRHPTGSSASSPAAAPEETATTPAPSSPAPPAITPPSADLPSPTSPTSPAEPSGNEDAGASSNPAAASASDEPSARVKPAPGKTGRGRVPNFGY